MPRDVVLTVESKDQVSGNINEFYSEEVLHTGICKTDVLLTYSHVPVHECPSFRP